MNRPPSAAPAPELPAALLAATAWPEGAAPDEWLQTHISWVFLVGEEAYKVKKPVRFDFVDFSTLELRRRFCEEELRINRRFAPDLYLGVSTIARTPAGIRVLRTGTPGAGEEVIDYAVRMRRFDRAEELDALVAGRAVGFGALQRFGERLALAQERSPMARPGAVVAGTLDACRQNFDALDRQAPAAQGPTLAALRDWTESMHERLAGHFETRLAAGCYRECHGDLHCGNVVRREGDLWAFDALEFDPALRWIDVGSDLAFLTMDLEARGRADLRAAALDGWLTASGDVDALNVLAFYEVYRACVRAKVAAIRLAQSSAEPQPADAQALERYLAAAARAAAPPRPLLIVMTGLSGSGKSWLAGQLLGPLGAVRVRSDVERKRLHGLAAGDSSGGGIYDQASTRRTYQRLSALAAVALQAGVPTVIDAACLRRDERETFAELGLRLGVPTRLVALEAPDELLRARIVERARADSDPSEADLGVLDLQTGAAEPLSDGERANALVLRTDNVDIERLARRLREPPTASTLSRHAS